MKKIILTTIFIYATLNTFSQWQWAKQIGGPYFDGGYTKIDESNNMYCIGDFVGTCFFENDTLGSQGDNDIFLAKYDPSGNQVWIKRIGGNNPPGYDEWAGDFVIDDFNNCFYLSGIYYGTLTIDSHSVSAVGGLDMFFAKFDLSGNCQWLRDVGSSGEEQAGPAILGNNGAVYCVGVLGSNGVWGMNNLNKGTFLAKIDSVGNLIWARNEMTGCYPVDMKIKNDHIYFCGVTTNDTASIDTISTTSSNYVDCLIGKLDTSGNVFWVKRFGGYSTDYGRALEMDANANFYVAGEFNDSLIIGNDTLSNAGKPDMFFGKFDSLGNSVWIRQSHADGYMGGSAGSIIRDTEGTFYLGGSFGGNAFFDSFNVSSSVSTSKDMFIARYDSSGECLGIRHFGEAETGFIQIDNSGSLIVSGDFVNTIDVGATTLASHGNIDMFFAKTDAFTGAGEIGERRNNQLLIYANPTQGTCNVTIPDDLKHEKNLTLSIYDNTGKLIQQGSVEMNEEKVRVNLEAEAKGIYNVTLSNGKKSYGGKIVFE